MSHAILVLDDRPISPDHGLPRPLQLRILVSVYAGREFERLPTIAFRCAHAIGPAMSPLRHNGQFSKRFQQVWETREPTYPLLTGVCQVSGRPVLQVLLTLIASPD